MLFRRLCGLAGIEPRDCLIAHVFDYQLQGNRLKLACTRESLWPMTRSGVPAPFRRGHLRRITLDPSRAPCTHDQANAGFGRAAERIGGPGCDFISAKG
jgi:hypothetical protein